MEHRITHACGHAQAHHLAGFAAQQERKARWLRTTACRTCFLAGKRAQAAGAAARHDVTVAHLSPADLVGSERQVAWATTLRARRLAALAQGSAGLPANHPCLAIAEATWWIDHRDLADGDLLVRAATAWRDLPLDAGFPAPGHGGGTGRPDAPVATVVHAGP